MRPPSITLKLIIEIRELYELLKHQGGQNISTKKAPKHDSTRSTLREEYALTALRVICRDAFLAWSARCGLITLRHIMLYESLAHVRKLLFEQCSASHSFRRGSALRVTLELCRGWRSSTSHQWLTLRGPGCSFGSFLSFSWLFRVGADTVFMKRRVFQCLTLLGLPRLSKCVQRLPNAPRHTPEGHRTLEGCRIDDSKIIMFESCLTHFSWAFKLL